jgi:diguanylate cyclase (GGDEF)-like protein
MTFLDSRTLIFITGSMSGLMALVVYMLQRNYPSSIRGLGEWAGALLAMFVGGLLVWGIGVLPDLLSISASTLLLWSGLYLAYVGTQRFHGITPNSRPWIILIAVVTMVQIWFNMVQPEYRVRIALSTAMVSVLTGLHAWLLLRQKPNTFSRSMAILVLTGLMATQLLRLVTVPQLPAEANFFDHDLVQQIYFNGFVVAILLFSISAVLMATDRLRTELEELAAKDSLTGAYTRRHMNEACLQELERCRRYGHVMSLLIMDLDHFKNINDSYGHQSGDKALIEFVNRIKTLLRRSDLLGRFGGEEFLLLLPETSLEAALAIAERIRAMIDQSATDPHYTVSIGVTHNHPDNDNLDTLLARADKALYQAKAQGRNRVAFTT